MRGLSIIGLAMLAAGSGVALAAPPAACLAPSSAEDGPVSLRDAKLVVYETAVPGGAATTRQTVVLLHACVVLSGDPSTTSYTLGFRPVLYSTDGNQLQGGTPFNQPIAAENPAAGGAARTAIVDTISLGYAVNHAKLGPLSLINVTLSACKKDGSCTTLPPVGTISTKACVADGIAPVPAECPAAAVAK
jgi:hypothetical protein